MNYGLVRPLCDPASPGFARSFENSTPCLSARAPTTDNPAHMARVG
jgi:hypothetical protein